MKNRVKILKSILIVSALLLSSSAFAKRMRYLVNYKNDKPVAQLATKWSKVEGGYEFSLDTSKEVAKGTTVTADIVKNSIEKKLKKSGMEVEAKNKDTVLIKFSGDEKEFWQTISKSRIKASNVQIAMDGAGSSGGIRANKISRKPKAGEVKASFISMDANSQTMEVFVYAVGPDGIPASIKPSKKLKIAAPKGLKKDIKKDDELFFKPVRLEGDAWNVKGISFK